ncbi:hypothetical protein ACWDUL_32670 [Nocardia niigatensis]
MTDSDTITGLLVSAVERAWAAIRSRHPDVPEVVLTVGSGSIGKRPHTGALRAESMGKW